MYLTFGKIYKRVQDDIECRIQLLPLPPHPNLRYAIDYTTEQAVAKTTIPSISPSKTPTLAIPPASIVNPVTYHDPTPKLSTVLPDTSQS
jgi:hypothetical protein